MKLKLVILVLVLQTAWILGTVLQQENIRSAGKIILLETKPVDPRDLLRGDFVWLNYKISDISSDLFSPLLKGEVPPGTKIYATLAPVGTDGFWEITRASRKSFIPADNEVLIVGKSKPNWLSSSSSVHIDYGIEKYFVAEGTGNPVGKLTAQVAVGKSGQASLKEVFLNGKPYADEIRRNHD
jgi:uncharacterized membrane-anchored protein